MDTRWITGSLWVLALAGCDAGGNAQPLADAASAMIRPGVTTSAAAAPECRPIEANVRLPDEVRETSGLARSLQDPGLFWTHNDAGNGAEIFALGSDGQLVRRVTVTGAAAEDWEDIESGSCDGGDCLYVADIGDNDGGRSRITIYRIPEPGAGLTTSEPAVALHARFPDRAQDSEGFFKLPTGDLYVVTKGRAGSVALYRYPAPERPGETVTLERVRELFREPEHERDRVTAATATADGRWVGIRSYRTLYLYPADALVGGEPVEPVTIDLEPVGQSQGESLVLSADGAVWLSSEAGGDENSPTWSRLQCTLPG